MAEVEAAAPAFDPVEVTEVPAQDDDKIKKPPKRLAKPSKADYESKTNALYETIKERKQRIDVIMDTIKSKRTNTESAAMKAIKTEINDLRAQWSTELEKKKQLRDELTKVNEARKALRNQTRDMKQKLHQITNGANIDDQIAQLESRLNHSTLPLNEEKKLVEDIKKLKASRATSAGYDQQMGKLNADDKTWQQIKDKMQECDTNLDRIQKLQNAVRIKRDELRDQESRPSSDIPGLEKERAECSAVISAAYAKLNELRTEFKEANDVYWNAEQEFRKWRSEEYVRKQKERAAFDAQRAAEHAEMAGDHYHKEVTMCEQLDIYLRKYISTAADKPAVAAPGAEAVQIDGYKVFKKKDEDADSLIGLSTAKKGGKKGKKGADKKEDKVADAKIVHPLDVITSFSTLNIEMPISTSKIPATLDTLSQRKAFYLDKRAQLKEKGVLPGKEPDANGNATANGHAEPSTSKGAGLANGNATEVNMSPETVELKLTVSQAEDVAVAFDIKGEAFPSLPGGNQ